MPEPAVPQSSRESGRGSLHQAGRPDPQGDGRGSGLPLPFLRWRGFTLQMFFLIVLPLSALLLVIAFGSQALHHDSMRALVGDRDLRAVRATANSLGREIEQRAGSLRLLAGEVTAKPSTSPAWLEQAQDYGFDGGLALLDSSGQVRAGAIALLPDFVKQAPAPSGAGDGALARVSFSQPVQSADGQWWVLATAAAPEGGRLVGAFSAASLARTALAGVSGPQTTLLLLSARGDLLYQSGLSMQSAPLADHPGVQEVLRGESGVNYSTSSMPGSLGGPLAFLSGHTMEHVAAFSPVPLLGWGLVLEEPWEENASPLLNATQSAPLVLAPVLILTLVALWFGARQVIQPLQKLETQAQRASSGDLQALAEPAGGISEIRNLQDALVEMGSALESAQEALHSYIGALTAGVETERRALARELHDDTLQALIALNQNVQLTLLRTADPQQRQQLTDLQERITETIANLRRAIGGLRPIYLEDLGLTAALGMLAKTTPANGAQVEFTVSGPERRLKPETELAFYRIAQEALNNALHHAHATRVQLALAFEPGQGAALTIRDNGSGFRVPADPGAFAHHGHYGLLGMHERAELADAQLKIKSEPGKGTTVTVKE